MVEVYGATLANVVSTTFLVVLLSICSEAFGHVHHKATAELTAAQDLVFAVMSALSLCLQI
jgi:hypothetical protein